MSKKIQLSIPTPCHENWDHMNPVEKGRFCGSCQKQVVDFSNMSDRQVAEFFKKPSTGNVCGRFMADQLDRSLEVPRKRIPWLKYFFQFALPAFLISMKASSQGKPKEKTTKVPLQKSTCGPTMGLIALPVEKKTIPIKKNVTGKIEEEILTFPLMGDTIVRIPENKKPVQQTITPLIAVKGKVVNEEGEAIPGATVVLNENQIMTADDGGEFLFNSKLPPDMIELVVSSVGYKPAIYNYPIVSGNTSGVDITIQLMRQAEMLGEVVVKNQAIMGKVSHVMGMSVVSNRIVKIDSAVRLESRPLNRLIVYPNPVLSGSTVNIDYKFSEGNYLLQLLNQAGQIIQRKEIRVAKGTNQVKTDIPVVATGTYFIVLINQKSSEKFTAEIIIQ